MPTTFDTKRSYIILICFQICSGSSYEEFQSTKLTTAAWNFSLFLNSESTIMIEKSVASLMIVFKRYNNEQITYFYNSEFICHDA